MEEKKLEEVLVEEEIVIQKPSDEDRVKRRRSYLYCLGSLIMGLIVATTLTIIHHKTPAEASLIDPTPMIVETSVETTPTTTPVLETAPEIPIKTFWDERREKYPVATEVWLYMKNEFGWSDIVCAGIMGNLMRETGGDTFHLKPNSNSSWGFGLVQWTGQRKKDIFKKYGDNPSIAEQLEFMKDELYGTNDVRQQVSELQRDKIFNANSAKRSAAEFARWFERPASKNYTKRKNNAVKAYEYFKED
jgi:hypothetical protein